MRSQSSGQSKLYLSTVIASCLMLAACQTTRNATYYPPAGQQPQNSPRTTQPPVDLGPVEAAPQEPIVDPEEERRRAEELEQERLEKEKEAEIARLKELEERNKIVAANMIGKWRVIARTASQICDLDLTGQGSGIGRRAHASAGCPQSVFSVHSWRIASNTVILLDGNSGVVARMKQSRPRRLEGSFAKDGKALTMVR